MEMKTRCAYCRGLFEMGDGMKKCPLCGHGFIVGIYGMGLVTCIHHMIHLSSVTGRSVGTTVTPYPGHEDSAFEVHDRFADKKWLYNKWGVPFTEFEVLLWLGNERKEDLKELPETYAPLEPEKMGGGWEVSPTPNDPKAIAAE